MNEKGKVVNVLIIFMLVVVLVGLGFLTAYHFQNKGLKVDAKGIIRKANNHLKGTTNYQVNWELEVNLKENKEDQFTKMTGAWQQSELNLGYGQIGLFYPSQTAKKRLYVAPVADGVIGYKETDEPGVWEQFNFDQEEQVIGTTIVNITSLFLEKMLNVTVVANEIIINNDVLEGYEITGKVDGNELLTLSSLNETGMTVTGTDLILTVDAKADERYQVAVLEAKATLMLDKKEQGTVSLVIKIHKYGEVPVVQLPTNIKPEASNEVMPEIFFEDLAEVIKSAPEVLVYFSSGTKPNCDAVNQKMETLAVNSSKVVYYFNEDKIIDEDIEALTIMLGFEEGIETPLLLHYQDESLVNTYEVDLEVTSIEQIINGNEA